MPTPARIATLIDDIVNRLMRRHSTATVLFHRAVAGRLGLGPTDHKCLDLLRDRGAMTASELAALTGITTGAMTGVVARLEKAGYVRREPDSRDRRQQILHPAAQRAALIHAVFQPIRKDVAALLGEFDAHQLAAIARFLSGSTDLAYHHVGLLRAHALGDTGQSSTSAAAGRTTLPARTRTRRASTRRSQR